MNPSPSSSQAPWLGVGAGFFLVLVICAGALASRTQAAGPADIEALSSPEGEPEDPIELVVPTGAADVEELLFLRTADGEALSDIQLIGRVGGTALEITPVGQSAGATVDIPAQGLAPVTVKVTDPPAGTQQGRLIASAGTQSATVASLTVRRSQGAVLSVAGAGADGVAFTSTTARFSRQLQIISTAQQAVDDLRIRVAPFVDAASEQVTPQVAVSGEALDPDRSYSVPALGRLELGISADLVAGGEYTSAINLVYGDQQANVPITVTRSREPLSIELAAAAAVDVSVPGNDGRAEFQVEVRETGGRSVVLPPPAVTVTRTRGQSQIGVTPEGVTIDGEAPKVVELAPDETVTQTFEVSGLPGPGQYTIKLSYPSGEAAPREVSTSAFARRPWLEALALLLVAGLVSFLIRRAWTRTRVRLLAQRSLSRVSEELELIVSRQGMTAAELPVVQAMRDRLMRSWHKLEADPATDVAAERDDVAGKLPLFARWLAATRAAREIGAAPAILSDLRLVGAYLRDHGGDANGASQAMARVEDGLADLPGLLDRIEGLERAFQSWLGTGRTGGTPAEAEIIRTKLREARENIDRNKSDDAEAAYATAWRTWLAAATTELEQLAKAEKPVGVTATAWGNLAKHLGEARAVIQGATSAGVALQAYKGGYAQYLETIITGLQADVRSRREKATDKTVFDELLEMLEGAKRALSADKPEVAWEQYKQAKLVYDPLVRPPSGRSVEVADVGADLKGGAPPPPAAEAAGPAPAFPTATPRRDAPAVLLPSALLTRQIGELERWVSLAAAGLAALLGLILLWEPNATWGSTNDIVVAVLWAFGLHQVGAAAASTGVQGVLDKFTGQQ